MIKRFIVMVLIVTTMVGIIPSSVSADIPSNIKTYYSGIMQELNNLDRYPSWETWRNGCLHTIKQYLDQWMLYAYNEEYIEYTMNIIKRLFASTCAVTYIGAYHLGTIRDYMCFLSGELSDSEFQKLLADSFKKDPYYYNEQTAELIAHAITNASTGLQINEIENLDSANFDMVISAFLNGDFGVIDNIKNWGKGSLMNIGASTALNVALKEAFRADGYNLVPGSDLDKYIDTLSNSLFSGSPSGLVTLTVETGKLSTKKLNDTFQSVDENFTKEMQQVEQHKIAASYRTTVISQNNIYAALSKAKTQEQALKIAIEEILNNAEILKRIESALNVEEIKAIEKELYVETEPADVELTDKVNLTFEEDVSDSAIDKSVVVFKDGVECTEVFDVVKSGNHSVSVIPKETVKTDESYKIVYYKNRKPIIHTVTYKETAVKSSNVNITSVNLKLTNGNTQTSYFMDTDTVNVSDFEEIISVKTEDENASYKIKYDEFGNGFIEVIAENGLNTAIYSVKNLKEATDKYSISIMKDWETSVKIVCDFKDETTADNLYVGVYDASGKLICFEKYNKNDGYAGNVPYIDNVTIGLLGVNLKTMQSVVEKYEIINIVE